MDREYTYHLGLKELRSEIDLRSGKAVWQQLVTFQILMAKMERREEICVK